MLFNQFKSPIVLILMFAAALSIYLNDRTDAMIMLTIVFISELLGFWQKRGASDAFEQLLLTLTSPTVIEPNEYEEVVSI